MKELLFDAGSLKVFKIVTMVACDSEIQNIESNRVVIQYAWQDDKSSQGFAPFLTLNDCMLHYMEIQRLFKKGVGLDNNVISVDFINRKRNLAKVYKNS